MHLDIGVSLIAYLHPDKHIMLDHIIVHQLQNQQPSYFQEPLTQVDYPNKFEEVPGNIKLANKPFRINVETNIRPARCSTIASPPFLKAFYVLYYVSTSKSGYRKHEISSNIPSLFCHKII